MPELLVGRDFLYLVVRKFLAGEIGASVFCTDFENCYNLQTKNTDLTSIEAPAFKDIFDKVVWYSPFPEDRTVYPRYLGETEIKKAVQEAAHRLGLPQSN